jgi:hypothetical protein
MMREDVSETERAEQLHTLGVLGVIVLWLPIFFWMAHLGSMAALVPYLRDHPDKWWAAWIDTGVFAAGTILCILVSIAIGVRMNAPENEGSGEGRNRFLAWHGVLAGLANLALILAEGSMILFISPMHR